MAVKMVSPLLQLCPFLGEGRNNSSGVLHHHDSQIHKRKENQKRSEIEYIGMIYADTAFSGQKRIFTSGVIPILAISVDILDQQPSQKAVKSFGALAFVRIS